MRNRSTPGIMSFGWGGCRHNKASLRACVWLSGISQILTTSNTLQHFDVLGICISIFIRTTRVCMCAYISAWASVLLVQMLKAMREPQIAEQQQCSPAFFMQMPCVCVEAEHYLASDRFFCVYNKLIINKLI